MGNVHQIWSANTLEGTQTICFHWGSSTSGYSQQGAVLPCPSGNLGMTPSKAVSGKVLSQPLVSVLQQCVGTCSCGLPILSSTELGNEGR